MSPDVSVIVAAGDREELTASCLDGLARQSEGAAAFEVIVIGEADPEVDETSAGRFRLRRVTGPPGDSLAARWNAGAAIAEGELLLFLSARVIPDAELVELHLAAHRSGSRAVVVGSLEAEASRPPGAEPPRGAPAARGPTPGEFAGQTLSVSRAAFEQLEGFDQALAWGAEVELAHRAIGRGLAAHRTRDRVGGQAGVESAADRFAAGQGNVELYRHTPALLPCLELGTFHAAGPYAVLARRLLLAAGAPRLPRGLDGLAARGRWRVRWLRFRSDYDFWRGVRAASAGSADWASLVRAPVILMYHAVGRNGEAAGRYIVPLRRFARQMAWLERRGYRVLSLADLVEARRRHVLLPPRAVIITFDDGYADNHELAYPILRSHRYPATFFLVSGSIGGRNDWDASGELAGRALISWDTARELRAGGMEIGAHTRRHPVLPDLDAAALREEVDGGRHDLEQGLGGPVHTFAYPFGRMDDATAAAVEQAGYEAACCSRSGANDPAVSQFGLRRLEIRGTDSMVRFALSVRAGRRLPRPRTT